MTPFWVQKWSSWMTHFGEKNGLFGSKSDPRIDPKKDPKKGVPQKHQNAPSQNVRVTFGPPPGQVPESVWITIAHICPLNCSGGLKNRPKMGPKMGPKKGPNVHTSGINRPSQNVTPKMTPKSGLMESPKSFRKDGNLGPQGGSKTRRQNGSKRTHFRDKLTPPLGSSTNSE